MNILNGPREERTNEQARARVPMNAAQVRWVIDQMMAVRGSDSTKIARVRSMAGNALRIGNVAEDGKAVWREWMRVNGG